MHRKSTESSIDAFVSTSEDSEETFDLESLMRFREPLDPARTTTMADSRDFSLSLVYARRLQKAANVRASVPSIGDFVPSQIAKSISGATL